MSEPTLETNPYTAALETIDKKTSSITDTDTLITNESAITMNSNHSSLADHYSYDASSSHDSLSTIATFDDKKKDLSHHSRAVAQTNFQKGHSNNNHPETNRDVIEIYDQLEELESKNQSLEEQSDSEGYIYDEAMMPDKTHKRHLSRCSVISTRSYDSTASNYDMLLARLGSKDTLVSIPINSPSKEKDDDIDWGNTQLNPLYIFCSTCFFFYRVLVQSHFRLQQFHKITKENLIRSCSKRNSTVSTRYGMAVINREQKPEFGRAVPAAH